MNVRRLGNSGILVSEICLGTMTFGWQTDEATSHRILDLYVEQGGNFLDTANVYSDGKSEAMIGSWLKSRNRSEIVLATKARFRTGTGVNDVGLSRKNLYHAVHESLKRLETDYIDLLQVHAWDPLTPLEETFGTLDQMVRQGMIRYVGISNYRGWQFEKALQLSRHRGWSEPVSLQSQYSLFARATEFELLPMCGAENVAMLPWSPLAGGFLSGKYRDGVRNPPPRTRIADSENKEFYVQRFENERAVRIVSAVEAAARESGHTMSQVALNWLLSHPTVTAPIIGARSPEQLSENLGSTGWSLTSDQLAALNLASTLDVTYPYDRRAEEQQSADRRLDTSS
ncbi:MAG TPA: aldo/keto reductase [Thermoplasmata archaeon]|nr:aldo/keto reductase [Thermoplasmata archaeon]HYB78684.1 aldo/keto reductase [Thermoplasmata archaeon]